MYGDRLNQLDFRLSKIFRFGTKGRIQGNVDLYNLFNSSPVLALNNTYGSAWERPLQILQGRLDRAWRPGPRGQILQKQPASLNQKGFGHCNRSHLISGNDHQIDTFGFSSSVAVLGNNILSAITRRLPDICPFWRAKEKAPVVPDE